MINQKFMRVKRERFSNTMTVMHDEVSFFNMSH